MIGHCRQWKPLPGSKSCRPGSAPHKFPGKDERITHVSDASNIGSERMFKKKKKVVEALLIETSWRKTSSAPNQTLPGAGRSAQLGLHRLCRGLAVCAICKIPTKRRVGNSPYFRGRHARVAQILVESQLQSWECLVEKMLAGKSVKLLVEAAWMSKIWSLRLRQGKGQSRAPQGSHHPLISFFCSNTAEHYFGSEQLFHELPRGLALCHFPQTPS